MTWSGPRWTLNDASPDFVLFCNLASRRELAYGKRSHWNTDAKNLDDLGAVRELLLATDNGHGVYGAVLDDVDGLAHVVLDGGQIRTSVAAPTVTAADSTLAMLREMFPVSLPSEGQIPVTFWTYSPHGPRSITRRIAVSRWDDIRENYASATRAKLEVMMDGFRPSHGGQLVLWQGEPGTGKTHALRALAWEWRKWAELHYVVDPEQLFGDHADYLIDVLLHETFDHGDGGEHGERWRVLVLEDTGELLAADAKERTGQALSRLLNTVDGMIGQGLKVLVLVTTNDELKALHPAVQRPGRCALQVGFEELSRADAELWLSSHGGAPERAHGGMSLAELYALLDGFAEQPTDRKVGFALH